MSLIKEYIFLLLTEEYRTKDGREITFKFYDDHPNEKGGVERGWKISLLEAYIGSDYVGHIKVSYIPMENFMKLYPTILHWIVLKSHDHKILDHLDDIDFIYNEISRGWGRGWGRDKTKEDKIKYINSFIDAYRDEYRRFKRFHVNKPMVDYIDVKKNKYENLRRQGIGEALYRKMSEIMKDKGMKLHASGIQSDDAKASWRSMDKKGIVGHKSGRRFLKKT